MKNYEGALWTENGQRVKFTAGIAILFLSAGAKFCVCR